MASGTHRMIFSTGEPAYAVNREGDIVAWNEAAVRAFSYPSEQALGSKCWDLLQGWDAFGNEYCGEACPLRRMAEEHHTVNRCRMAFRTAGGERRTYTVTTLVLFDDRDALLIHMCRHEPHVQREKDVVQSPGELRPPGHGVLTTREQEVLHHLADGHDTCEIATLMSVSPSTVRGHVEHILRKLHAHSRLEAVAVGRKLGLE